MSTMYNTRALESKWANAIRVVESVKGKMNPEKKGALLHSLENTQRLVKYTESTNPGYYLLAA